MSEIVIDERPACPRCGEPMNASLIFICGRGAAGGFELPPTCSSKACQQARDEAALERAIAAGVIDP